MASKTTRSINDLPDNCLLDLFGNYLDFKSRLKVQNVCKLWKYIIDISLDSVRCLIIADYHLNDSRINRINVIKMRVSVVTITANLRDRTDSNDRHIIAMVIRKHRNLHTLSVCLKFTKCNNKLLSLIAHNCCPSLQSLRIELSNCSINNRTLYITHEEVVELTENLPYLTDLYIDYLILHITDAGLRAMFNRWPAIESLVLHSQAFRGYVSNTELENVLTQEYSGDYFRDNDINDQPIITRLSKLELPGNVFNMTGIQMFPHQWSTLKKLMIIKVDINCLEIICQKFGQLVSLGFSIETNVNEEDMHNLWENCAKCLELQHLYVAIHSGVAIDYPSVRYIRKCENLKALLIDQTLIKGDAIDAMVQFVSRLQRLELFTSGLNSNVHHLLTDDAVRNVKRFKHLQQLNLRSQRKISDQVIAAIISRCQSLIYIDIRTTKAAILTLEALIHRSHGSDETIEAFINETSISRLFDRNLNSYKLCEYLVLSNEEYDYKIDF